MSDLWLCCQFLAFVIGALWLLFVALLGVVEIAKWLFNVLGNLIIKETREAKTEFFKGLKFVFFGVHKWFFRTIYKPFPVLTTAIIVLIILGTLTSSGWFWESVGTTDLEKRPSGIYCYYVKVDDYILPAEIWYEPLDYNSYEISVYRAYFKNGGYLDFKGQKVDGIGKTTIASAQDEEYYKVTVLNLPASHPKVKQKLTESKQDIRLCWFNASTLLYLLAGSFVLSIGEKFGYRVQAKE